MDAQRLGNLVSKQLFRRAAAVNELVLVDMEGLALVIRISSVNTLDEAARDEALSYHCYRGLVTPDTVIYLTEGEYLSACISPSCLQSPGSLLRSMTQFQHFDYG